MTMTYVWYESYRAVVLETDWTRMHERIHSAESKLHDRQRVLLKGHDGTPQEKQAIASALNAVRTLRQEVAGWDCSPHVHLARTAEKAKLSAKRDRAPQSYAKA